MGMNVKSGSAVIVIDIGSAWEHRSMREEIFEKFETIHLISFKYVD